MKKLILAVLLSAPVLAQAQLAPTDWYKIGRNFGSRGEWQFGFDKSATLGACAQRELHDGQWLVGPCRDLFVLARDSKAAFHLGFDVMYNAEHLNASYGGRMGFNAIPLAQAVLAKTAEYLPYLERAADWTAPPFLRYVNKITTLDYGVGWRPRHSADVHGSWTHGPMAKLDIPLSDLSFIQKFLGF